MPRRKNRPPTVEEARSIKTIVEQEIFEYLMEFEHITGLKVDRIEIVRKRAIGFGATETMEVNVITEQL